MKINLSPFLRAQLEDQIDLERIAKDHALTGGSIMNVVRDVSLQALSRDSDMITLNDMSQGIRREHAKEGMTGLRYYSPRTWA